MTYCGMIGLCAGLWLVPALQANDSQKAANPAAKAGQVYQIPFRLTDTQHILVRAKINGKGPFNFIIDTGAPMLFVSVPIAKKIGLEAAKDKFVTLERFEMEGGAVQNKVKCRVETPFQLEGMNAMGLAGAELHGIIGYTVLAQYKLEFDFTRDRMKWTQLAFTPPPPQMVKLGKKEGAGMAGLEAMGGLMKFLAALSGIRPGPPPVPRGFLGLEVTDNAGTVAVRSLVHGGPAARAGLKVGDRIHQVQGMAIKSVRDLFQQTAGLTVGQTICFAIVRGQEKLDITITAGEGL